MSKHAEEGPSDQRQRPRGTDRRSEISIQNSTGTRRGLSLLMEAASVQSGIRSLKEASVGKRLWGFDESTSSVLDGHAGRIFSSAPAQCRCSELLAGADSVALQSYSCVSLARIQLALPITALHPVWTRQLIRCRLSLSLP